MANQIEKTILQWVITGQKQIKEMSALISSLDVAQQSLNKTVSKSAKAAKQISSSGLKKYKVELRSVNQQLGIAVKRQKQFALSSGKGVSGIGKLGKVDSSSLDKYLGRTKQIEKATRRARHETKRFNNETRRAADSSKGLLISWKSIVRIVVGSSLSRGIGIFTRTVRQAAQEAAEFQIKISEIRTISQNNQLSFSVWADAVKDLSDEFNRAPLDVTEGLYQALSNQIAEGAEAVNFMTDALQLAQITASTTEQSVQALTAILNSYGLAAEDATRVTAILFKTQEQGRVRLGDFSNTIGRLTVLAGQMDISLEEITATFAKLTLAGLRPNEALTQLRGIMLKLIRPSEKMKELFDEWGVPTGKAAAATFGFIGIFEKLRESLADGNDELEGVAEAFNRIRPAVGAAGILSDLEGLKEAIVEMEDASTSAGKALEIATESAGFNLQREVQRISNFLTLEVGGKMIDDLSAISDSLGGISNVFETAVVSAAKLTKALATLAVAFGVLGLIFIIPQLAIMVELIIGAVIAAGSLSAAVGILAGTLGGTVFIFAAVAIAAATTYNEIAKNSEIANRSLLELNASFVKSATEAFADASKASLKNNADRVASFKKAQDAITRIHLGGIGKRSAAISRLRKIEEDRATVGDLAFQAALRDPFLTRGGKEKLFFEELKTAGVDLQHALANPVRDLDLIEQKINDIFALQDSGLAEQIDSQRIRNVGRLARQVAFDLKKEIDKLEVNRPAELDAAQAREDAARKSLTENTEAAQDAEKRLGEELKNNINTRNESLTLIASEAKAIQENADAQANFLSRAAVASAAIPRGVIDFVTGDDVHASRVRAIADSIKLQTETVNLQEALFDLNNRQTGKEPTADQITPVLTRLESLLSVLRQVDPASFPDVDILINVLEGNAAILESSAITDARIAESVKLAKQTTAALALEAESVDVVMQQFGNNQTRTLGDINDAWIKVGKSAARYGEILKQLSGNIADPENKGGGTWRGGYQSRFASGGSVASDSINALLQPGEFVMNARAARKNLPQLVAANSGAANFNSGGQVSNTNVGDININVKGGDTSERTVRNIASSLRREIQRGTVRLN